MSETSIGADVDDMNATPAVRARIMRGITAF
jgi:hypothetical protein